MEKVKIVSAVLKSCRLHNVRDKQLALFPILGLADTFFFLWEIVVFWTPFFISD